MIKLFLLNGAKIQVYFRNLTLGFTCVWGDRRFESDVEDGEVKEVEEPDEESVELSSPSDLSLFSFSEVCWCSCLEKGFGNGILSYWWVGDSESTE